MYPHWSPMQPNEKQTHNMTQQPLNQGCFQFQQTFPCMSQQQSQSMFSNFVPFSNNIDHPNPMNIPSNGHFMYAENNNSSSGQYQSQSTYSSGTGSKINKISYERHPNQEQYASYSEDAIYRHASGPGWQKQEVFYPTNTFK